MKGKRKTKREVVEGVAGHARAVTRVMLEQRQITASKAFNGPAGLAMVLVTFDPLAVEMIRTTLQEAPKANQGTPRFYIATAFTNQHNHNVLRDQLIGLGHEITVDWTLDGKIEVGPDEHDRSRDLAHNTAQGVKDADYLVVLLPGGRGTHTEIGMALITGKKVFLHAATDQAFLDAEGRACPLYHHDLVQALVGPLGAVTPAVRAWAEDA